MSNNSEGIQFPTDPSSKKTSSSQVGCEILASALNAVNLEHAQALKSEKNWRKNYPIHFKRLVENGLSSPNSALSIAADGLKQAHASFKFQRDSQTHPFTSMMQLLIEPLNTFKLEGKFQMEPECFVPYQGKNLKGDELRAQIQKWLDNGIIELSHAQALIDCIEHPEWFDLSDRTMVLFGAASEAGPLTWLAKWRANIVAIDLNHERVWTKILNTVLQGNATLYAPTTQSIDPDASIRESAEKLGVNLLTHCPEIAKWLVQFKPDLDLAAIAYLDGEKHVRVSMAMDAIMEYVSLQKSNTSLMYMCTPTDVYAVPQEVIEGSKAKFQTRSKMESLLSKSISSLSQQHFFKPSSEKLFPQNDQHYGICDCLVVEQGPNYALAKRIQQWRATLARSQGQKVSINIAPSTTTRSVTKNPLLKAAFNGANLFGVEAFEPATTNAIMAALWIHDLRNPQSVANPEVKLNHPLELMMHGANHGGLWRVAYLARTALPFAAIYGFVNNKVPVKRLSSFFKK